MQRFTTLLITCLFILSNAYAQQATVKGMLKDKNQPVSFATVEIDESHKAYTGLDGSFKITDLSPGTYQLTISSIGYTKKEMPVTVSAGTTTDLGSIVIEPRSTQIPEITISTVIHPPVFSQKYTSTSNIVSMKELETTQAVGTEEVLKKISGVNVAGDMGISNRLNIGIRGSYPRRSEKLMLLEDGTPIAPAPYLAPEAYYNPPSDRLDGIEIIKGADVLTYGANSMYGVVNYITKRPPVEPQLGINLTGGSHGYQSQFITYGGTWKNTGAELQVLNKKFDGFIDNSSSEIQNVTAKVFSDLGDNSSFYLKANYHSENSNATYSALTPLTYSLKPTANPFDADDLESRRYAIDMSYNRKLAKRLVLISKVYGSQFERNWWRQENTVIRAADAETYLGESIFRERYSYLSGLSFGSDDYIRVGKINSAGRESTKARNRLFRFAGLQETLKLGWKAGKADNDLEISGRYHAEEFFNLEMLNDSSRFARSGRIDKDERYTLRAVSASVKNTTRYGKWIASVSARYENVLMRKYDRKSIANDPLNNGSPHYGSIENNFWSIVPGISLSYEVFRKNDTWLAVYGGAYQGYTAPTSGYGFLTVEDDVVSSPSKDDEINMDPEISFNAEGGIRATGFDELFVAQAAYFNNTYQNYYSAGREEAFQSLGEVRISGTEIALNFNLDKLLGRGHQLNIGTSFTFMNSEILSGVMKDADLLKAKHTSETKNEILEKINGQRQGYDVYFAGASGDSLVTNQVFTEADFSSIKRVDYRFGSDGIKGNVIPYIPEYIMNYSVSYWIKGWMIGANLNMVSMQYTDHFNLSVQTAEGAMGKLPAYSTVDANLSYTFSLVRKKWDSRITAFVAAKNLTDEVYMASRLHRVSSGIMPGGFRQLNAGVRITL